MKKTITSMVKSFMAAVLLTTAAIEPVLANDSWPTKPVTLIVPVDPGNIQDNLARLLARHLSAKWHQSVNVVNQPGAGMTIGTNNTANSAPDGHTLLFVTSSFTGSFVSVKNLPYTRDKLVGVVQVGRQDLFVFAHKNAPFDTPQQMAEWGRKNPGKIEYGSPGSGTYSGIAINYFNALNDMQMITVPYKSLQQMAIDLATGRIMITGAGLFPALKNFVERGDVKIIGSVNKGATVNGAPVLPLASAAPEVFFTGYYGLVGPAGIPKYILDRIHADVSDLVNNNAEFKQAAAQMLVILEPTGKSGDWDRWIDVEIERIRRAVSRANIKFD